MRFDPHKYFVPREDGRVGWKLSAHGRTYDIVADDVDHFEIEFQKFVRDRNWRWAGEGSAGQGRYHFGMFDDEMRPFWLVIEAPS